jgi:hypothetical protein
MPSINLTLPVAGTNIAAGLHATNYSALQTLLNGGLDNTNVAEGAAIAVSKIAPGTNGQVLTTVGGATAWGSGVTTYRKVTEKDVHTSVAETDLLNGEITIGAGEMSTNKIAKVILVGDYLNNSGAGVTLTIAIKLGATTLYKDVSGSIEQSADRRAFRVEFEIANLGAANSQWMGGKVFLGHPGATTNGIGDLLFLSGAPDEMIMPVAGSSAEDTATAKTLVVTVQHSASAVTVSARLKYALVEIV